MININTNNVIHNTKEHLNLNSKEINEIKINTEIKEIKKIDEIKQDTEFKNIKHEIELSNTSFGYNQETKDFFVKVKKGNIESQFPTEEMMKLKANLKELYSN